jgi:DNA polymerase III epsilon subunit-like protein
MVDTVENRIEHVMVDLETMDNKPTAAITAIGAVAFDPDTGELGERFYVKVDLQTSMDAGLTVSADTINWWLMQADEPRKEMARKGHPLPFVLEQFSEFLRPYQFVWGNGAAFDNAILQTAYAKVGQPLPWKFWNDRCYRTVKSMYPDVKLERVGNLHNALDDAVSQATHLIAIYKEINHGKIKQSEAGVPSEVPETAGGSGEKS